MPTRLCMIMRSQSSFYIRLYSFSLQWIEHVEKNPSRSRDGIRVIRS